jgi:lipopolysaccharide export system permease protein
VSILGRYVLRELFAPFVGAFAVLTFVMIMNHLLKIFDLLLGRGVPLWAVARLVLLMLPFTFALTVPMAVLVATLMAFGRLSGDNETVAVRASGTSLMVLLRPALGAALVLSLIMVYFNNMILPQVNHQYASLYSDVSRKKPAVTIREGVFVDDFPGYHILIQSENKETGELSGVTIYEDGKGEEGPRAIVAARGILESKPQQDMITFHLFDGEIHELDSDNPGRYRRLRFKKNSLSLSGLHLELERRKRSYKSDRELTTEEINAKIAGFRSEISAVNGRMATLVDERLGHTLGALWPVSPGSSRDIAYGPLAERRFFMRLQNEEQAIAYKLRDISRYEVEIQKKFSVAFSCVVFVLIGAPIGIITRRGGIGTGLGISLVFFVVYYIFLIGGEELADRRFLSPAVAMWAANAIVGLIGLYLVSGVVLEWRLRARGR